MGLNEKMLTEFFNTTVSSLGIQTPNPVLSVWLQTEGTFCFVEFRSVADCTSCMTLLQGITIGGRSLRVGRPADYKAPPPALENYTVGFPPGTCNPLTGQTTPGPTPSLASNFSPNSKFSDTAAPAAPTPTPVSNINPARLAQIREAGISSGSGVTGLIPHQQQFPPSIPPPTTSSTSRVLLLQNMVTQKELVDDDEFTDIVLDIREECEKFGPVKKVVIPRPKRDGKEYDEGKLDGIGDDRGPRIGGPTVGKIFVLYKEPEGARKAREVLNARMFNNNKVDASYFPEDEFYRNWG
jgi:splicing factor U2AF subunit